MSIETLDFRSLNMAIYNGTSNGRVLWQPRIDAWYRDREFGINLFPPRFKNMSRVELYKDLKCSARLYQYSRCFEKLWIQECIDIQENLMIG